MKKIYLLLLTTFYFLLATLCLYATMLDNMESLTGWNTGGDTLSLSLVSGYYGNAVKMSYSVSGWTQMYKRFDSSNLSGGDSIRLYVRGTGNSNNLELKLFDSDGDIAATIVNNITNMSNWTPVTVSFTSFNIWRDSNGNPYGNGTLNTDNIIKYGIDVTRSAGGVGTVLIDEVSLYQQNPPGTKLIDDCETRINKFNNTISTHSTTGSILLTIESSNPSPQGGNYYAIAYTMGNDSWLTANEYMVVGVSTYDATSYSYINFYLKVRTSNEVPKIELWDTEGTTAKTVSAYGALSTSWKFYSIPIADFGRDKSKLREIKILFNEGNGTVYFDHLWFSTAQNELTASGAVSTINSMEGPFNPMTYPTYKDQDATCSLSAVSGMTGNAMQISYDLKSGWYVIVERGTGYNAAQDKGLRFKFKGTGQNNNLELKISDMNDTNYIKKFYDMTNTNDEWKTATIPFSEFSLFAKGTKDAITIDLKNLKNIYFAVTKSGGSDGAFIVDELETISDPSFTTSRPDKIITNISINNNPFSPNGDGLEDTAEFSYTIKTTAKVELKICNTDGDVIKTFDEGEKTSGTHIITWEGKGDEGDTLRNGLYFYKLSAEDYSGTKDKIVHLIGVIR